MEVNYRLILDRVLEDDYPPASVHIGNLTVCSAYFHLLRKTMALTASESFRGHFYSVANPLSQPSR